MLSAEIEETMRKMNKLSEEIPKRVTMIKKELSLCQLEENDIKHKIEICSFNASQGYYLCRDLQITLQKRRELKDELVALEVLLLKSNRKQMLTQHASQIVQSIKDRKRSNDKRTYSVRVRKDFVDNNKFVVR